MPQLKYQEGNRDVERLSFENTNTYSAVEAAIHTARYAVAKPVCQGRDVLDIACGEGYGSALLKEWGAASVDGVDISEDAIKSATEHFERPGIRFKAGRAEDATKIFSDRTYDLIISLETFEHVDDPKIYLREIKALAKPNAVIIISCPNDHWYYPSDDQGNPFHKRKYTFQECREICEAILGPATWRFGGPSVGFMATPGYLKDGLAPDQTAMMSFDTVADTVLLPPDPGTAPSPEFSSYFVGIWGAPNLPLSAAIYPTSMKVLESGFFSGGVFKRELDMIKTEIVDLKRELDAAKREIRLDRFKIKAIQAENSLVRESAARLTRNNQRLSAENDKLRALTTSIPWRAVGLYKRIRKLLPQPVIKLIGRSIDKIRAAKK
jgi:hypothetical protein